ncbi:ABC transporter substrate-binding protein [Paenibacillus sp. EPM92]|uniref:ABC transporter substrate-binding protein n=1 Tax=Paenibacillus sp. EPM92 TaxID=1561195 RepID=UPI0019163234|nr:ABC transporter substrate-binding protein [Paenibacillus sp. EPM92]
MSLFKNKLPILLSVCILMLTLIAACGNNPGHDTPANTEKKEAEQAADQGSIKIGVFHDISGPGALPASMMLKGSKVAVQMINDEGGVNGRSVELVVEDDAGRPENAARIVEKLASNEEIVFLSGGNNSSIAAAADPVARKMNIPFMVISGAGYEPKGKDSDLLVASTINFITGGESFIKFALEQGWKRGATLNPTDVTGQLIESFMDGWIKQYKDQGLEIVARERYDSKALDVTPQLSKIKEQKPDFIMSYGIGETAAIVIRQSQQVGLKVPIGISGANAFPAFLNLIKDVPDGQVFTYSDKIMIWKDLPDSDPHKKFLEKYYLTFKKLYPDDEPSLTHSAGADSILIGLAAVKQVGADREKIRKYLSQGNQNIQAVQSTYNFTADDRWGYSDDTIVTITNKQGKWKLP